VATIWANSSINADHRSAQLLACVPDIFAKCPSLMSFKAGLLPKLCLMQAKEIAAADANPSAAIKEYCSHKFHRPSMMQHLDRASRRRWIR